MGPKRLGSPVIFLLHPDPGNRQLLLVPPLINTHGFNLATLSRPPQSLAPAPTGSQQGYKASWLLS